MGSFPSASLDIRETQVCSPLWRVRREVVNALTQGNPQTMCVTIVSNRSFHPSSSSILSSRAGNSSYSKWELAIRARCATHYQTDIISNI